MSKLDTIKQLLASNPPDEYPHVHAVYSDNFLVIRTSIKNGRYNKEQIGEIEQGYTGVCYFTFYKTPTGDRVYVGKKIKLKSGNKEISLLERIFESRNHPYIMDDISEIILCYIKSDIRDEDPDQYDSFSSLMEGVFQNDVITWGFLTQHKSIADKALQQHYANSRLFEKYHSEIMGLVRSFILENIKVKTFTNTTSSLPSGSHRPLSKPERKFQSYVEKCKSLTFPIIGTENLCNFLGIAYKQTGGISLIVKLKRLGVLNQSGHGRKSEYTLGTMVNDGHPTNTSPVPHPPIVHVKKQNSDETIRKYNRFRVNKKTLFTNVYNSATHQSVYTKDDLVKISGVNPHSKYELSYLITLMKMDGNLVSVGHDSYEYKHSTLTCNPTSPIISSNS